MTKADKEKKERDAFERMISRHINAIIKHADRYKLDRDETIAHYAELMAAAAEIATFKNYKIEEDECE